VAIIEGMGHPVRSLNQSRKKTASPRADPMDKVAKAPVEEAPAPAKKSEKGASSA
jgi:hypothetical protein